MLTGQDDVSLNKAAIIERALRRMKQEYTADPQLKNYTHIDALILNIERACRAAIDLAMHLVAQHRLGIPQNSAEAFTLLFKAGIIKEQTARDMVAMTGFRNVAIHEYQSLNMNVVHMIAREKWKSLVVFCKETGTFIQP
jgi:uncharacterized protein YutE (UPF0331/DUF86 family)